MKPNIEKLKNIARTIAIVSRSLSVGLRNHATLTEDRIQNSRIWNTESALTDDSLIQVVTTTQSTANYLTKISDKSHEVDYEELPKFYYGELTKVNLCIIEIKNLNEKLRPLVELHHTDFPYDVTPKVGGYGIFQLKKPGLTSCLKYSNSIDELVEGEPILSYFSSLRNDTQELDGEVESIEDSNIVCWINIASSQRIKASLSVDRFEHAEVSAGDKFKWYPKDQVARLINYTADSSKIDPETQFKKYQAESKKHREKNL